MDIAAEIQVLRRRLDQLEGALLHADKLAAEKCRSDFETIMGWVKETFGTNDLDLAGREVNQLRTIKKEAQQRYFADLEAQQKKKR